MRFHLAPAAILSILLGCVSVEPVFDLRNAVVPAYIRSAEQVKAAIEQAGYKLGWRIYQVEEGRLEGVLEVRTHHIVVDIRYSAKKYSILYHDSLNMHYNESAQTIHNKYDNWIRNLDKQIQLALRQSS